MKHCVAQYQELDGIHSVSLNNFSPMTWKNDSLGETCPKLLTMVYGILLYYKVSEWWNTNASWNAQTESWKN